MCGCSEKSAGAPTAAVTPENCGAVILAGGRSRRMGQCKALLQLNGETLIARLARQLALFDECWISSNDERLAAGLPGHTVKDIYPGCGPMAGLHAALSASQKEYIFCVSCDLPFFTDRLIPPILKAFSPGGLALVCTDPSGRIHPLCGIYAKAALPVLERRLRQGQLRMTELLEELHSGHFPIAGKFPDRILENVNTPESFAAVLANERRSTV